MQAFDSRQDLLQLRKQFRLFAAGYFGLAKTASVDLRQEDGLPCLLAFVRLLFLRNLLDCGSLKYFSKKNSEARNLSEISFPDLKLMADRLSDELAFSMPNVEISVPELSLPPARVAALLSVVDTTGSIALRFDERFPGYLYQFYAEDQRSEALRQIQTASKTTTKEELIAFTQLYTPSWAADYLVRECLEAPAASPETSLTLLDPSCGSGHVLLRAFDFFFAAYKNRPEDIKESVRRILEVHITGADIDPVALWMTGLSFRLKTLKLVESDSPHKLNLCDASRSKSPDLGSLALDWPPEHPLAGTYDAVVTNPPYIGRKLLARGLKESLRISYPLSCHDLSAAFLERGLSLLKPGGRLGFITQSSLLYLPSYEELRSKIIKNYRLVSVVELGSHAFPLLSGEKVNSMLFVAQNLLPEGKARFIDLRSAKNKAVALTDKTSPVYRCCQKDFLHERRQAFNYRLPSFLSRILSEALSLGSLAEIKQGLATTDNARFIRNFWEVPPEELGKKWFPYVKGAGSARWWSPVRSVVNWENNGEEIKSAVAASYPYLKGRVAWVVKNEQYYFRPGLTFSLVNSRQLAVRELPPGCIFDVAGSALFVADELRLFYLAYLNSSFISVCASMLNPTLNFQVGDLKLLPVVPFTDRQKSELVEMGARAVTLTRELSLHPSTEETAALLALEEEIDALVLACVKDHYSLTEEQAAELDHLCREQASYRQLPRFEGQANYPDSLTASVQ